MKNITLIFICLFIINGINAQSTNHISLKKYCPTTQGQEGAICFAYATTYTALSIEHNIRENKTDEALNDFNAFSFGFVASKVKKNKPFFGRLFNKCGRNATAKLALEVLQSSGTVPFKEFKEKCDCSKIDKVADLASKYKIKTFNTIGNTSISDSLHIKKIKYELTNRKPVITTILQESFFYNNNDINEVVFPNSYEKSEKYANHVVCIVGFDDNHNGGSFIIKNNYKLWGKNGFAFVKYEDFIKLIRTSYTIEI